MYVRVEEKVEWFVFNDRFDRITLEAFPVVLLIPCLAKMNNTIELQGLKL